jgi:hypothetical protein
MLRLLIWRLLLRLLRLLLLVLLLVLGQRGRRQKGEGEASDDG